MTNSLIDEKPLDLEIPRDANGAPCPCGGYADEADVTKDEIKKHQTCGRSWACCLGAFVCRVCKRRFLVNLPAPEMD